MNRSGKPMVYLDSSDINSWGAMSQELGKNPLQYCPEFPKIAQRHEAFWEQDLVDRPLFIAYADTNMKRSIDSRVGLLNQPDIWFEEKKKDLEQCRVLGDALPHIQLSLGPMPLANIWGGHRQINGDTIWTHAFINDEWTNAPDWQLGKLSEIWTQYLALLAKIVSDARGRYLIVAPDWGVAGDLIATMRGTSETCIDIMQSPEKVKEAVESIYPVWLRAFRETYDIALSAGVGVCQWLKLWSNKPYAICGCDISSLLGVEHFKEFFLPDIARQAKMIGRAIYHLDGPAAIRHLDAILEVPEIRAIQYSPPPPYFSALPWIDVYKKIQDRGRSILLFCPPEEVLALSEALNPAGLGFVCRNPRKSEEDSESTVYSPISPETLEPILDGLCRQFL